MNRGVCPRCGKLRFLTRREARTAAHRHHPGAHLSAYLCGEYWHYGALSHAVMRGIASRGAVRRRVP